MRALIPLLFYVSLISGKYLLVETDSDEEESLQSKSRVGGDYVEELLIGDVKCDEAHQPENWKTCIRLNDHIISKSEDCRKTVYKVCFVHCCQPEISLPFMLKCFPKLKDFQTKCSTGGGGMDYKSARPIYKTPCADFEKINVTFKGHINP